MAERFDWDDIPAIGGKRMAITPRKRSPQLIAGVSRCMLWSVDYEWVFERSRRSLKAESGVGVKVVNQKRRCLLMRDLREIAQAKVQG